MKTDNSIIYSIRWDNLANESYLYGSNIIFEPDGLVRFSNLLMPPGQIIRKWQSATNYQATRHEPQLPMLEEGVRYEIRTYASYKPAGTVKLRIRFFDRQGENAGSVILDDITDEFVCPDGASDYELELINAGAEELVFHHIEIQKKSEADKNVRIKKHNATEYVLILEPTGSSYIFPEERLLKRFENRVILTCEGADAIDLNSCITDKMPQDTRSKGIVVIGYGTRSNASAFSFAKRIGRGVRLCKYVGDSQRPKTGIERIAHEKDKDSEEDIKYTLMAPLYDKTIRLTKLKI